MAVNAGEGSGSSDGNNLKANQHHIKSHQKQYENMQKKHERNLKIRQDVMNDSPFNVTMVDVSSAGLKNGSMLFDNTVDNDPYEKSDSEIEIQRNTVDQFLAEEPPTLQFNQKCSEHPNELVVAYHKLSFEFLCSQCVWSQNIHKEQYQVYPSMVKRITEKISAIQKMIKFRYMQLEQTSKYIKKVTKKNKDDLTKKFANHIKAIKAYFDDYKKRQSQVLNDALIFQEQRVTDTINEIDRQLEKLENDSVNLATIQDNEQNVLVCMNDMID